MQAYYHICMDFIDKFLFTCLMFTGPGGIKVSRVSGQETHFICQGSSHSSSIEVISCQPGDSVACLYDDLWWIGSNRSTSDEHDDVQVLFMHPHDPSKSFKWPQREDVCWVSRYHILCKILAPITKTGRLYDISVTDRTCIEKSFSLLYYNDNPFKCCTQFMSVD